MNAANILLDQHASASPAMSLGFLLTSLHQLFVVALKRENLAIFLLISLKSNCLSRSCHSCSTFNLFVSCNPIGFPRAWCRGRSAAPTQPLVASLARLPAIRRLVEERAATHPRFAGVETQDAPFPNVKVLSAVVPRALVRLVCCSCNP